MPDASKSGEEKVRDYKDTLFLPKTNFPMRAGLPQREPEWLARWADMDMYGRLRAAAKGRRKYILHDGPPYANGHIHMGTALTKILKDLIVRSRQMTGLDANYVPGWDCHGLPIEWKVEEEFRARGKDKRDIPVAEFRRACRDYAQKWLDIQRTEFRRLGGEGDWDHPYTTMAFDAEAAIVSEFLKFVDAGLVYRGSKPVMWSPVEQTALAEAEIEYHDRQSATVWVKFPVVDAPVITTMEWPTGQERPSNRIRRELKQASIVIWTTTPWTIPGNRAISYGPKLGYGIYEVEEMKSDLDFKPWSKPGDKLVVAKVLAESVREAGLIEKWKLLVDVPADALKGVKCAHPLKGFSGGYQFDVPLLAGDHVTDEDGTGFVHTAPGHGAEDYYVWMSPEAAPWREALEKLEGKEIPHTVDEFGAFTDEAPGFEDAKIIVAEGKKKGKDGDANQKVIEALIAHGALLARGRLTHSYPHSWRSKAPVIFRNTPQWFIAMDRKIIKSDASPTQNSPLLRDAPPPHPEERAEGPRREGQGGGAPQDEANFVTSTMTLRELALKAIDETGFTPPQGKKRIRAMVETRPDWLISRQRAWGAPLTIFVNKKTGDILRDPAVDARIIAAIEKNGADIWFDTPTAEFLGPDHAPEDFEKIEDILDVWFDSGSTHAFVLERRADLAWPADVYCEGSDQHRGWFQSSLLESCGTRGRAPYRHIVTNGFVVDGEGRKMSKSLGNVMAPEEVIKNYGAEIIRIWVASADYTEDPRISPEIIGSAVDAYRKLRNTLRYLLGALDGFDEAERIAPDEMPELERYILHRLAQLDAQVREAYEKFDFKTVWRRCFDFAALDLSAFYLDIRKDSLYCDRPDAPRRRAARTVMDFLFERLVAWIAPICVFTAEEAQLARYPSMDASIHLTLFPETPPDWRDDALAAKWKKVRDVRRVVTGALEVERREKRIGASLEAAPVVHVADAALLKAYDGLDAAELFITSGATLTGDAAPADAFRLEGESGDIAVEPAKAAGEKCRRCWRILADVGAHKAHADLCGRCADAVDAYDAAGA